MAKRLFLLIIAGILGIINSPTFLSATEEVAVTGLDSSRVVETVPLPEPEPESVSDAPVSYTLTSYMTTSYVEPTVYEPVVRNYTVTYHVGTKAEYQELAENLGWQVYKYQNMVYGHNSWGLLGSIVELYVGDVFTVTDGGVTTSYQVMNRAVYNKNLDTGKLEGVTMGSIAKGGGYDLALFTCHGQALPGNDATQRFVVYANRI